MEHKSKGIGYVYYNKDEQDRLKFLDSLEIKPMDDQLFDILKTNIEPSKSTFGETTKNFFIEYDKQLMKEQLEFAKQLLFVYRKLLGFGKYRNTIIK